jgi:drug/metabolite transporter (DMT)-like permease
MTLALLRFLVAASVLFAMLRKLEPNTRMARQDMPLMAVSGLGLTAYFFFQNVGIQLTTASTASMILATIPILTVVGEFLVFKTKLSLVKIISVILSIAGVYFIVAAPQQESSQGFLGDLFMLGASVAWVIYSLTTRPLSSRYSQLAIVTYQTIFSAVALLPSILIESWEWSSLNYAIILHLLYLGIFCSAVANYLYVYAMSILGVGGVSLFINLIPVISVLGGFAILQEPVSSLQIFGGAVILLSVYIANYKM